MPFKIKESKKVFSKLNEVPQPNNLRWTFLHKEGDILQKVSAQFKCRDFFNDIVASIKGHKFVIYGMNNDIPINEEGQYLLLENIEHLDIFEHNMAIVNDKLKEDLNCEICWVDADEHVILIPKCLYESTYFISLVTWLIRSSNYGVQYKNWNEFFQQNKPGSAIDRAFSTNALKTGKKYGFTLPEKLKKYWWFFSEEHNSEKDANPLSIHNNGVSGWSTYSWE